jgi:hypothetical protein
MIQGRTVFFFSCCLILNGKAIDGHVHEITTSESFAAIGGWISMIVADTGATIRPVRRIATQTVDLLDTVRRTDESPVADISE